MPATIIAITWRERPASHRLHGGLLHLAKTKTKKGQSPWGLTLYFLLFGSGGVIALAPAGLSYVGRLSPPRSALFR